MPKTFPTPLMIAAGFLVGIVAAVLLGTGRPVPIIDPAKNPELVIMHPPAKPVAPVP